MRLAEEHDVDLILLDAALGLLESGLPDQDLRVVLERAPCDVAVLVGSGELGRRADRDAVRRRRARLARDRAGRVARAVARDDAPAARNGSGPGCGTPRREPAARPRVLARAAGGRNRDRAGARPPPARRASSKARATPVCSSSACPTAGGPRASARRVSRSPRAPKLPTLFVRRGLRSSGVAPGETLTRFTWTLGSETSATQG